MAKFVSFLYPLARTANDIEKISSGNPKRIARRAKNKFLSRKVLSLIYRWSES
ncbi:MAG: hypothetical protein BWY37_01575 [Firmicutes bacterium ADurb.Bin262]|nr:MAG: hypothetical protein BWY37_01575 [Firmicutes bacterium ADurb.Bin262]